jgi:hypothetical protein
MTVANMMYKPTHGGWPLLAVLIVALALAAWAFLRPVLVLAGTMRPVAST